MLLVSRQLWHARGHVIDQFAGRDEAVMVLIGGAPEAALTACAVLCLGGDMQCRLWCADAEQRAQAEREGLDLGRVFGLHDLCRGDKDVYMAITGITESELLRGVRYRTPYAITQSLVMRSSTGTARRVESTHDLRRLAGVVGAAFETPEDVPG